MYSIYMFCAIKSVGRRRIYLSWKYFAVCMVVMWRRCRLNAETATQIRDVRFSIIKCSLTPSDCVCCKYGAIRKTSNLHSMFKTHSDCETRWGDCCCCCLCRSRWHFYEERVRKFAALRQTDGHLRLIFVSWWIWWDWCWIIFIRLGINFCNFNKQLNYIAKHNS